MTRPEGLRPSDVPLVILCGGKSERMGVPKGLLELPTGETLLEWQLARFAKAGGTRAVVVFGFHAELYLARKWNFAGQLDTVLNPEPELGPFRSLQAGLSRLGECASGVFVLPVDAPAPKAEIWEALPASDVWAAVPEFQGRGQHPVWIHGTLVTRLMTLDPRAPDARLDVQLRGIPAEKYRRLVARHWPYAGNLNRPEDFAAFCAGLA